MNRVMIYPGAIPLETDLLNDARNAMVSLGALASALFGSTTTANKLVCTATSPASMSVQVGPGEIYAVGNIDNTPYSSLAADVLHQTVKQGINLDDVVIACPAPGTAGQSINYLIEATFTETDADPVVLPYYNSSDPTTAYSGPANSGAAQPTVREGVVTVTAKPGIAAATGTQATPAPDSGYIGLAIVTVPYGATTLTASNITVLPGSVVPAGGILAAIQSISYASRAQGVAGTSTNTIVSPDVLAQSVQGGSFNYAVAAGTANALTASLIPAPSALAAGMEVIIKGSAANTGAATLALNGGAAKAITLNGSPLPAGVIQSGQLCAMIYDGTSWQLVTPTQSGIIAMSLGGTGYKIYANGLIEQWGINPAFTNQTVNTVTFPIAFPNACLFMIASLGTSIPLTSNAVGLGATGISKTQGQIAISSTSPGTTGASWFAIGN